LTGSDLAVEVVFESRSDKVDSSPWTRAHITRATMERFVDDSLTLKLSNAGQNAASE